MRRKCSNPIPCWNYECPHNLFWKELKLKGDRIRVTKKAREIGNCCCLINTPWTAEEIEAVWGIPTKEIRRVETTAWKKIYKKNCGEEANTLNPW